MKQGALIVGATGLVGGHLLRLLLDDDRYEEVKIFVRRATGITHPKLLERIVDFEDRGPWKEFLSGDVLFSCLGTTIKKAGTKEKQYRVDYTYQYETAAAAADNGVATYVLISSSGADSHSRIFYTRMKGELDRDVKQLPFQTIRILKPSVLVGERREKRPGEAAAIVLGKIVATLIPPLRKYRPIPAEVVARAMIEAAEDVEPDIKEYELGAVFELVR